MIMLITRKISFLFLVWSGLLALPQSGLASGLLHEIRQELDLGKIVVIYHMSNDELDSEQYADWSTYLNEFASSKDKRYTFHASDKEFDSLLKAKNINAEGDYTLFMKKGDATYYYDGVILESMVYVSVDKMYTRKPMTDMDKIFLPDTIDFVVDE